MRKVLATLQAPMQNILYLVVVESFAALRVVVFAKEFEWQKVALEIKGCFTGSFGFKTEKQKLVPF